MTIILLIESAYFFYFNVLLCIIIHINILYIINHIIYLFK